VRNGFTTGLSKAPGKLRSLGLIGTIVGSLGPGSRREFGGKRALPLRTSKNKGHLMFLGKILYAFDSISAAIMI
jgi:hypothetical protein